MVGRVLAISLAVALRCGLTPLAASQMKTLAMKLCSTALGVLLFSACTKNAEFPDNFFEGVASPTAPIITSTPQTTAVEGFVYSYTVIATGSPTPTISITVNPPMSWIIVAGNNIGGTPTAMDIGVTFSVSIEVGAESNLSTSQTFTIDVLPATAQTGPWSLETIDTSGTSVGINGNGQYTSLEIDSNDIPHVVYYDGESARLKYATQSGASIWAIEDVDPAIDGGEFASLVLDSLDVPHVAYKASVAGNVEIRHAYKNATGAWVIDPTIATIPSGGETEIGIDATDTLHVAYISGGDILHSSKPSGGAWSNPVTVTSNATDMSMVAESNGLGLIHIAYFDYVDGALKHATNESGLWITQTLDAGPGATDFVGQYNSIDATAFHEVHVCYYYESVPQMEVRYLHRDAGGTWDASEFISSAFTQGTSVRVDSNFNPRVCFHDQTNGLVYATEAGGTWTTEVVDNTTGTGEHCSIAIDSNGKARASYFDFNGGEPEFANEP